ncbi:dienelactone hydrolase family protein [Krasilnikoviella flava]|uniref:Dienelactone hydrolase n=1 Tax=Krasilnikoviella flava TaxID=526729 RepID=A0A1T5KYB0_9MICO|nr:alpha/beta hydrolase [Krasilnikoviella flava]SKC68681.1 hypothetical protein SAMN04324258_2597 [Krasilnikoviella flava]
MNATPSSTTLTFTTEQRLDDGVLERRFTLNEVPGILWTPPGAASAPVPLLLLGHPGGQDRMYPRLAGRARRAAADGFASATIEGPGTGDRPRDADADRARADLRAARAAGEPVTDDIVDRLVLPLVDQAVPEWRSALDTLLAQPGIRGPVGYSGGVIAVGVRLAVVEPRIVAAGLFAGSFVPRATLDEARRVTVPLHVLLQWDDEGNDRQAALDLFDAFGSAEKTLQANLGGHTGVPAFAAADAARFFARHLR